MVKIGSGVFRDVYKITTTRFGERYKGCVVKIAKSSGAAVDANRAEFHTWMVVKGTELEELFCPIRDRSENFEFLIMERANFEGTGVSHVNELRDKIRTRTDLTSSVVHESLDIKNDNIGIYQGRPVVLDYPWGGDFDRMK